MWIFPAVVAVVAVVVARKGSRCVTSCAVTIHPATSMASSTDAPPEKCVCVVSWLINTDVLLDCFSCFSAWLRSTARVCTRGAILDAHAK